MQTWRVKGAVLTLLALGLLQGCGGKSGGGGDDDDDLRDASLPVTLKEGGTPDGEAPSSQDDATVTGMDATGECVPKGCQEIEAELGLSAEETCGLTPDGCGGTVDCGGCDGFDTCGGGGTANRCGCTPKSCEQVVNAGQLACGTTVPDGCGGNIPSGCGNCEGKTGAWECNTTSSVCECAPVSKEAACGATGRVCGTAPAGCGLADYSCGSCSAARDCGGNGTCACKAPNDAYAATACGGKTCGTVLVDGCTFNCGPACVGCNNDIPAGGSCASCGCAAGLTCKTGALTCCAPATPSEQVALCAGRGCDETVVDPCTGATISCACQGGQVCVGRTYFEAEREKGANGKSQCVSAAEANILGGYVAITHQYTKFVLPGAEKAETVSIVTVLKKKDGTYQMIDKGCAARTFMAKSVAPAYFNMPPSIVPFVVNGNAWERGIPKPTVPVGFEPAMPSFCTAPGAKPTSGADYATNPDLESAVTASSGYIKSWLGGNKVCTCPTTTVCTRGTMSEACLPTQQTGSVTSATDCRLNDPDRDGRPGYSVITELTDGPVTAASSGDTKWTGTLTTSGIHYGQAWETKPLYRHFLSCGQSGCFLLGAAGEAPSCGSNGNKYNRLYLRKIDNYQTFEALTCGEFYAAALDRVAASTSYKAGTGQQPINGLLNAAAIEVYFNGKNPQKAPLPTCSAANACAEGSICSQGVCKPMTIPGACTTSGDQNECSSNPANDVDGNPSTKDWTCRDDKSCGPASC